MLKSRLGFTLIELMITIILICVLASIAIPIFNRTIRKQDVYTTTCKIVGDLRNTRRLAITNSSINPQGYSVVFLPPDGPYTHYQVKDESTGNAIGKPVKIAPVINCTSDNGSQKFRFLPDGSATIYDKNGNPLSTEYSKLTLASAGTQYDVYVARSTGFIRLKAIK